MTRFFANANYDFIGVRKYAYALTAAVILPGLLFLLVAGLNYSIEFTGGTLLQITTKQPVDVAAVRTALDRQGVHGAEIQQFGSANEYVIRARVAKAGTDANDTQATASEVGKALDGVVGQGNYTIQRTEAVGPKVGSELRQKAFLAIFLSFFAVLAYLAYRFEWRFGLTTITATTHDIIATIAFIGVMRLEVSLMVVDAMLSMMNYSLNVNGGLFPQRHHHHLRPSTRESPQAQEGDLRRDSEPFGQRDAATQCAHPRDLACDPPRASHFWRRGDPPVRPGDVLRGVYRDVLLHLYRLAGPHGHRAALAGP